MADTKIRITAETAQAEGALRGFGGTLDGIGKKIMSFSGIAGALSIGAFATKLVSVQREFDVLNSSLITVTGSSDNAKKEFAWIKDFASTTPYQLNEVTGAFVKMKALGLDASREALTSYGNTASAMGKDLNQMIEAVADAATGEFERLKEFGIKASKNGDDVSLTFKGVTTTVRNSADEITGYLQGLGNNDFAGAMALRAATLDGAISNLADTWDGLFRTINEGNAGGLITDGVRLAIGAVEDLNSILGSLNETTKQNAANTGALKVFQEALATVFETVAVLGVNVKYVLVTIGKEIGGIAAQASAVMQGEFGRAAEIHRIMLAEADAARKEVDATTARILKARTAAGVPAPEGGATTTGGSTVPAQVGKSAPTGSIKKDPNIAAILSIQNEQFRKQMDMLGVSAEQVKVYELAMKGATTAQIERAQAAADSIGVMNAQIQAEKDHARAVEEAQRVIFDLDPIAKASAEWEKLIALKEQGLLTDEQIAASYAKTFGEIDKSGTDAFKSLESAVRGWGDAFTDEMTKMIRTGKADFASLADSIINDLVRIQVQKRITEPLMGAATGALDSIFGSIFANAKGGVYGGAGIAAYSNTVVNKPTLFPFARGIGLMGEAGPEAIMPLTRVNGKLGVQASGGAAGDTYYIDARGADQSGMARLEGLIRQLNGSIERRALGAVNGALVSRGQQPIRA